VRGTGDRRQHVAVDGQRRARRRAVGARRPAHPALGPRRRVRRGGRGRFRSLMTDLGQRLDSVFKAYDIRGLVPDQLDADLCRRIGAAFARFAGAPKVLVARDMRPSGVELSHAFADGLRSPGAMFTASHNPAQYNGIKLCLAGAAPVGEDSGLLDIKQLTLDGVEPVGREGTLEDDDLLDDFAAHVRSFVDVANLQPLSVVADTANGMGGLVVPLVFAPLPFTLEVLYGDLDGTFPNHPADPIQPENLRDLVARVREIGADAGLAFDGDADRVFLVDDRGEPVSGSTTTAIVAKAVLEREPGATILHNCICSKAVAEVIRENGGTPIRTRVGHSFIKKVMAETGAAFGGEHSAHYYFRDNYRADSGSIAALVVLEQLCRAGVSLSELREPFERYAQSGEINTRVSDPHAVIEEVA